jgi:hypothetical protein
MTDRICYERLEDVYKDVYGIVEANSFESLTLWQHWHQEKGYTWVQNNSGWFVKVGEIMAGKEVWISPLAHIVNGRKILFVDATSSVVDWGIIEEYLKENVPSACTRNGEYLNKESAQNFHCLVH